MYTALDRLLMSDTIETELVMVVVEIDCWVLLRFIMETICPCERGALHLMYVCGWSYTFDSLSDPA
jgi:hypothetical protein